MDKYREYDHVIWDADTYPEVCVLGESIENGFVDVKYNERITNNQLKGARHATGKEILDYYRKLGADI